MAKQRKYGNRWSTDFFRYKEGEMSDRERNAFERRMQKDPFEADAAEGLSMVSRQEAEEDLQSSLTAIRRRKRRRSRIAWYSTAAAIAALAIVATVFFRVDDGSLDKYKVPPEFEEAAREQGDIQTADRIDEDSQQEDTRIKEQPAQDSKGQDAGQNAAAQQVQEPGAGNPQESIGEGAVSPSAGNAGNREIEELKVASNRDGIPEVNQVADLETDEVTIDEVEFDTEDEEMAFEMSIPEEEELQAAKNEVPARKLRMNNTTEKQVAARERAADRAKRKLPAPSTESIVSGEAGGVRLAEQGSGRVSGIIRSADDLQPLPGVSVFVKGTDIGTVTDISGAFSLSATYEPNETIVASFVGMETEEFAMDTTHELEIAMVPDSMELNEVVVIGYDSRSTDEMVGAVSVVNADDLTPPVYYSPVPVIGMNDYKRYIDSALVYPPVTGPKEKEIVVLKFYITRYGTPNNITVIRSPSDSFSEEAIRIVVDGPEWEPATRDGEYVNDPVRLRVVFRPD